MPLRSKAQLRKYEEMVKKGEMSQAELDKWIRETPDLHRLPERVGEKFRTVKPLKVKVVK